MRRQRSPVKDDVLPDASWEMSGAVYSFVPINKLIKLEIFINSSTYFTHGDAVGG